MATSSAQRAVRELPPQVLAALAKGQKIEAITLLRQATGLGLREAKELIDRHVSTLVQGELPIPGRSSVENHGRAAGALAAALKDGDWGRAIKQAQQLAGRDLSAATQAIDKYTAMRRHSTNSGLSPGEVPNASEWKTWVTVIVLAVIAYFVLAAIFR